MAAGCSGGRAVRSSCATSDAGASPRCRKCTDVGRPRVWSRTTAAVRRSSSRRRGRCRPLRSRRACAEGNLRWRRNTGSDSRGVRRLKRRGAGWKRSSPASPARKEPTSGPRGVVSGQWSAAGRRRRARTAVLDLSSYLARRPSSPELLRESAVLRSYDGFGERTGWVLATRSSLSAANSR